MSRTRCQFVVLLWQGVVIRGRLILAVRISRVSSSVHGSSRDNGAEWVVRAESSRNTSGHLNCLPLAYMMSLLLSPQKLVCPPLSGSFRSRDQSGNIARSEWYSSLPLAHMVSKLASVGNLCSPPGSSSRSRDKSGYVARNQWKSSLASSQGNQRQGDNLDEHVETTAVTLVVRS